MLKILICNIYCLEMFFCTYWFMLTTDLMHDRSSIKNDFSNPKQIESGQWNYQTKMMILRLIFHFWCNLILVLNIDYCSRRPETQSKNTSRILLMYICTCIKVLTCDIAHCMYMLIIVHEKHIAVREWACWQRV